MSDWADGLFGENPTEKALRNAQRELGQLRRSAVEGGAIIEGLCRAKAWCYLPATDYHPIVRFCWFCHRDGDDVTAAGEPHHADCVWVRSHRFQGRELPDGHRVAE